MSHSKPIEMKTLLSLIFTGLTLASVSAAEPKTLTIDLPTALKLAQADNAHIAAAREAVNEADARLSLSRLLWIPDFTVGASFEHHDGPLQESSGRIRNVSRSSAGFGAGVSAIAAGTPGAPGLSLQTSLADAFYEPLAAKQDKAAVAAASKVMEQAVLLEVAEAYFELERATAAFQIQKQLVKNAAELAKLTTDFADSGEGLQSDSERAKVEHLIQKGQLEAAKGQAASATARLAALLHLPVDTTLTTPKAQIAKVDFVEKDTELANLIAQALSYRPEVRQSNALIASASSRVKQARNSVLFPHVSLGASAAGFAGSIGGGVGNSGGRTDFTAAVFWRLDSLGLGTRQQIKASRSILNQHEHQKDAVIDGIVAEVRQAHALIQSQRSQIAIAEQALKSAKSSFELNRSRIFDRQGLPIEVLQAIQSLARAHLYRIDTVTAYNQAQFRLAHAVGGRASE